MYNFKPKLLYTSCEFVEALTLRTQKLSRGQRLEFLCYSASQNTLLMMTLLYVRSSPHYTVSETLGWVQPFEHQRWCTNVSNLSQSCCESATLTIRCRPMHHLGDAKPVYTPKLFYVFPSFIVGAALVKK